MSFFDEDVPKKDEGDFDSFLRFLKDTQSKVEAEQVEPTLKEKAQELGETLLTGYAALDKKQRRDFTLSLTVLGMSLWAKHRVRQGLRAAGVPKKEARLISLAGVWGAWALAANATVGHEYARYQAENALYPDSDENA